MIRKRENEGLERELYKRIRDALPEDVRVTFNLYVRESLPTMILNIITNQYQKASEYLLVYNPIVTYHIYLTLKDFESLIPNFNTDAFFRRFDIWNENIRELLEDYSTRRFYAFEFVKTELRNVTKRNEYSPRWLFWSLYHFFKRDVSRSEYTYVFEKRGTENREIILQFDPQSKKIVLKKRIESDLFDVEFLPENPHSSYTVREIDLPDPEPYNTYLSGQWYTTREGWLRYAIKIIPYIYQMFATGYILASVRRDAEITQTLMIGSKTKNCSNCQTKIASHKCSKCMESQYCGQECFEKHYAEHKHECALIAARKKKAREDNSIVPFKKRTIWRRRTLEVDGFEIYPNAIPVEEKMVQYFTKLTDRKTCELIFNETGADGTGGDQTRKQVAIPHQYRTWWNKLRQFTANHFPTLKPTESVVLLSRPGGAQQKFHADYEPTDHMLRLPLKYLPMGMLYAFQPGTKLVVMPGAFGEDHLQYYDPITVYIEPGDVLVFRPDLVHAGAAYDEENRRVHAFLDSPVVKRPENETCIMDYD